MRLCVCILILASAFAGVAFAQEVTFVETFETGNEGGWIYGGPGEVIEPTGGNPGAYYRSPTLDTFAPQARTSPLGATSLFTGDFRARGVSAVGIDLITHYVDFSAEGRDLSVILYSHNGTPSDFNDDWGAYYVGPENIPLDGAGWKSFQFAIPSQETSLPAGWGILQFGPTSPPNPDWNDVITNVSRLIFFYGDPTFFYIFQMWDVGMDNVSVTYKDVPCAKGAVNLGCGPRHNVLYLNEQTGEPTHVIEVTTTTTLTLTIDEPFSRRGDGEPSLACVYAWTGMPGPGDTVAVPKGLGDMCFGPYILATKNPRKIWNAIGYPGKLGTDNAPGDPPVIPDMQSFELLVLPGGLGRTLTATFQGIVEDDCSQGTVPLSVTNGFVLQIVP